MQNNELNRLSFDIINSVLFETDPMNTYCQENECFDEYDFVASSIFEYIQTGATLVNAIAQALGESFGDDFVDEKQINLVAEALNKALSN